MAKLNVTMDTETKELMVSIDGKAIENASSVELYADPCKDDCSYCSFSIRVYEHGEDKVSKVTTYSCYGSEKVSKASISGNPSESIKKLFKFK